MAYFVIAPERGGEYPTAYAVRDGDTHALAKAAEKMEVTLEEDDWDLILEEIELALEKKGYGVQMIWPVEIIR